MEKDKENVIKNCQISFDSLSPEEQYRFIVPSILSANGYLKWRLKSLLNSIEIPDLLTLLPPEIQLIILSLVDGSSLLKACQVCKQWNELIISHDQLWKEKCHEMGVNMEAKPENLSWQTAFSMSQGQARFMEVGKAFRDKFVNLQNSRKAVKAVDYSDGYLCTVSEDELVTIWQLEMNIPVLSFRANEPVSCIKFHRYSTLVCGHFTGILSSWDLSDATDHCFNYHDSHGGERDFVEFSLLKCLYKMHTGPIFSCDFSESLQLLVSGSADEKIKFWCLTTGVLLHTINSLSHWVLRVILLPVDSCKDSYSILSMTRDSVDKYDWPKTSSTDNSSESKSPQSATGDVKSIKMNATVKLNESKDNFITPGLQISSKYIGLVKQDLQEKQAILELHDIHFRMPCFSLPLNFKVRKLMALGNRFALLLTVGKVLYTSTLVIYDVKKGAVAGTHTIPHSKMTTPDGAQMVVGETQWLDGLQGWDFFDNVMQQAIATPRCAPAHADCEEEDDDDAEISTECIERKGCDDKSVCSYSECGTKDVESGLHVISDSKNIGSRNIEGSIDVIKSEDARIQDVGSKNTDGSKDVEGSKDVGNEDVGGSGVCTVTSKASKGGFLAKCSMSSHHLVLAAGVRSEEGRVFTLWWGRGEPNKKKVE